MAVYWQTCCGMDTLLKTKTINQLGTQTMERKNQGST